MTTLSATSFTTEASLLHSCAAIWSKWVSGALKLNPIRGTICNIIIFPFPLLTSRRRLRPLVGNTHGKTDRQTYTRLEIILGGSSLSQIQTSSSFNWSRRRFMAFEIPSRLGTISLLCRKRLAQLSILYIHEIIGLITSEALNPVR